MSNTATILQAVTEYQAIFQESNSSHNASFTVSGKDLTKFLTPSNGPDKAIEDIRELSKIAQEIKQAFTEIGCHFVAFDNANFRDNDNRVLKLGGQWRIYQIRFQTILDKSFDNASAASAFMQQYSKTVMTDVGQTSYAALRDEIQVFVKRLETKAADALCTKNEFTQLANDVRILAKLVGESLRQVDSRVMSDLKTTRQELDLLRTKLYNVDEQMKLMTLASVKVAAPGGLFAGAAVFSLSPSTLSDFMTSIIRGSDQFKQLERHYELIQKEITVREEKLASLAAQEHLIAKYQSPLDQTTQSIDTLARKVEVIVGIWQYLRSDMIILQQELALASDPDMPITSFFLKKIRATRELYAKLATLLEMYAKGSEIMI
ncbi:hypothetical protein FKP32DRAFT_1677561 [Trametes sanguinea]|nr:hypothetical protein FKP32DRAFT_1677561 [Trametes sanguinea]